MKKFKTSLYIFRRDLRLEDNTALISALKESELVIPCFILDTRQITDNKYKSERAISFMLNSLSELDKELKAINKQGVFVFNGIAEGIIEDIIKNNKIEAIYFNKDYTPFSLKRDQGIKNIAQNYDIHVIEKDDAMLNNPNMVLKNNGEVYQVFTAYFNKAQTFKVEKVQKNKESNYYDKKIAKTINLNHFIKEFKTQDSLGGRKEALKLLKRLKDLNNYNEDRNFLDKKGTSNLSAHNKFGTISIREFYHSIIKNHTYTHPLIKQLHWRDFFMQISYHYPHVYKGAFREKYNKITWSNNNSLLQAWKDGKTGYPIVDAGMRELNHSGYMHNRARMICASFLVKNLHINWQEGEKYFAQKLIDYDPAVNNGNWQWVASTGCDAQPYFRVFNPFLQQKKYDKNCVYIKKWVGELKNVSNKDIHKADQLSIANYQTAIINYKESIKKVKEMYKKTA